MNGKGLLSLGTVLLMLLGCFFQAPAGADAGPRIGTNGDNEPNGDFANATTVIPGTGNTIKIPGTCSATDTDDYYKIQLNCTPPNAEFLNVTTADSANLAVRLFLYDPMGLFIVLDGDPGPVSPHQVVTTAFVTGVYYVRYEGQTMSGNTEGYNITFKKTTVAYTGDSNNTPAAAVQVSSFPANYNGDLDDTNDQADWYCMTLSSDGSAADVVTIYGVPANNLAWELEVFFANFSPIGQLYEPLGPVGPGMKKAKAFGATVPGTYYVRVLAIDTKGPYTINFQKKSVAKDNNNDAANAAGLPGFTSNHWLEFDDTMGTDVDIIDYFSYPTTEGQIINATLYSDDYSMTSEMPQISLELRDSTDTWFGGGNVAKNTTKANGIAPETTGFSYIKATLASSPGGAGHYRVNVTMNIKPMIFTNKWESTFTVNESSFAILDLTGIFYDDDGDTLTYTAVNNMAGKTKVSFAGNSANFSTLEGGWTGLENYTVTATDTFGYSAQANIHVDVVAVNHIPYILDPDINDITMTAGEVRVDTFNLTKNFYDNDILNNAIQDYLTYHFKDAGELKVTLQLKKGTLRHSGGVTIEVPPMHDLTQSMLQVVTFWATDKFNLSTPMLTCNITIIPPPNTIPRWTTNFTEIQMDENNGTSTGSVVELANYCSDPDLWDRGQLSYVAKSYNITAFTVTITGSQARIVPKAGYWTSGTETITFNVTDTKGASSEGTVKLTVKHIYTPPVITTTLPNAAVADMDEGASLSFAIMVKVDAFIAGQVPPPIKYRWYLNGSLQTAQGSNFTYKPDFSVAAKSPLNITVTFNDSYMEVMKSWRLTVRNVNQPPVAVSITVPSNYTNFTQGTKITFRAALASDPDDPGADLKYSWKDGFEGVTLGSGQTFTYGKLTAGQHTLVLVVTDADGGTSQTSVVIKIKAASKPTPFLGGMELVALMGVLGMLAVFNNARRKK